MLAKAAPALYPFFFSRKLAVAASHKKALSS